jgi:hypothetical protein
MSNDEMTLQAGKSLREYSDAKTALAHSEELLSSIAGNHERVAQTLRAYSGENFTSADKIIVAMGAIDYGAKRKLLLEDGDRLEHLLREHESARSRVKTSLSALRGFGFGNVE